MSPGGSGFLRRGRGLPRRCGDVPRPARRRCRSSRVAPQVRGCPRGHGPALLGHDGCPAGAGMSRVRQDGCIPCWGLPRRCGDVPEPGSRGTQACGVAPQVRGCPDPLVQQQVGKRGCPAGAGMSRHDYGREPGREGLPRRCGDVPICRTLSCPTGVVAPQVRGCPASTAWGRRSSRCCPAGAGMRTAERQHHTFQHTIDLRKPKSRKSKVKTTRTSQPKPRARKQPKPSPKTVSQRTPLSPEEKALRQKAYDAARSNTPERREQKRLRAQEQRRQAGELGLCRDCPNPAKPGQTRCETCAEKHRASRRRAKDQATQKGSRPPGSPPCSDATLVTGV